MRVSVEMPEVYDKDKSAREKLALVDDDGMDVL